MKIISTQKTLMQVDTTKKFNKQLQKIIKQGKTLMI